MLVQGRRGIVAIALSLVACGAHPALVPEHYWELVKQFDPTASWLVLVRDLVLVAVFAALVVAAGAAVESRAREPEPA